MTVQAYTKRDGSSAAASFGDNVRVVFYSEEAIDLPVALIRKAKHIIRKETIL